VKYNNDLRARIAGCWQISILLFVIGVTGLGCREKSPSQQGQTKFQLMPSEHTGITFSNDVPYSDSFNCYIFRNFYNGGGVGVGDVNNDGLPDIFFCGNMVSNRLYQNKGNFQFEDITVKSGLSSQNIWTTGVAMVDINGDGWLDIYTCKSGNPKGQKRYNELFINNKDADANGGIPTFREEAALWGLDNKGLSTHAAFFDYDHDGDLDCYLLNNSMRSVGSYDYRPGQRNTPDPEGGNKLLRNDGQRFTDISAEAGIYRSSIGFGLGVTVGDYDADGWQDLFVSNDFFERDYLYRNLGNGRFEEILTEKIPEISKGSMGADMADLNNDGFPEIFVTEMTPPDDARYKTKASFDSWNTYQFMTQTGYHRQFGRNVLQINQKGTFSDVGRQAGVAFTDWSWGALLADFDNDGWKDIFVANGIGKDLLDQDYINFYADPAAIQKVLRENPGQGIKTLIDAMPSVPVPNFLFQNKGDANALIFNNVSTDWGLSTPSFSNGSAYGDLDNDGDLDLVVNNVNMPCFVYRNNTVAEGKTDANWLKIKVQGEGKNTFALGAKATVSIGDQTLYQELAPMRGFESCVEPVLHFGLGKNAVIDELRVVFPSGKVWKTQQVKANQVLAVSESMAQMDDSNTQSKSIAPIFIPSKAPDYQHIEKPYNDFDQEPLNFRMYSAEGPALAVADVNADGLEDFYIGGGAGQSGKLYIQNKSGAFDASQQPDFEHDKAGEDVTAIFFDANADGAPDLYVGSGSSEFQPGETALSDRLYLNDGKGRFRKKADALPGQKPFSTACARAADIDGDGDMDIFAGMRMVPGHYAQEPTSFLMLNDGLGNFRPQPLRGLGMVTDATWADVDGDRDPDLIVIGEWEPVRIFQNNAGQLNEFKINALAQSNGWWNAIHAADLDADGDPDFVLGNWGDNSRFKASAQQPMSLYISDFDQNGRDESILCQYNGAESYPMVLRNDLVKQLPMLKKKYLKYEQYQNQTIADIFTPEQLKIVSEKKVNTLKTSVLWNKGSGNYELSALPYSAQQTPIFALNTLDANGDGLLDIAMAGNHERCKPETGIYLGSDGLLLLGDGQGGFLSAPYDGLSLSGATRALSVIKVKNNTILMAAQNNGRLMFYRQNR
jgi:enediyne biosynthesis protein E4